MDGHEHNSTPKWKSVGVKERRLRPIWLLVSYLPIVGFTALVLVMPGITLLKMLGYPSLPTDQTPTSWNSLVEQTLVRCLSIVAFLVGTWIWRKFLWKRGMTSFGLGFHRRRFSELGIGLLAGAGLTIGIFVIEWLAGWIQVRGLAWHVRPPQFVLMSIYLGVITAITAAAVEEILMRGYILQTLEECFGLPAAVVISSALFGVGHLISSLSSSLLLPGLFPGTGFLNPAATGWANYVIPFSITLGGFMFASAYLYSRSLWLPIGLHFAWNFFEYQVLALAGVSPERASVLITDVTGPSFWVGLPNSSFGPEVGALGVLAMVFCIGMFWWLRSKKQRSDRQAG